MMTLRQRLFIIVGTVVTLVVIILLYLYYRQTANDLSTVSDVVTGVEEVVTDPGGSDGEEQVGERTSPTSVVAEPYSEDVYLAQLAKIFVERFYSYSTQNNSGHITDSLALASPSMQAWMNGLIKDNSADYEGVVTSVFTAKLAEKTESTATILIQTQQKWERKQASAAVATQEDRRRNGRVTLVKVNSVWLVDGLFWDKE